MHAHRRMIVRRISFSSRFLFHALFTFARIISFHGLGDSGVAAQCSRLTSLTRKNFLLGIPLWLHNRAFTGYLISFSLPRFAGFLAFRIKNKSLLHTGVPVNCVVTICPTVPHRGYFLVRPITGLFLVCSCAFVACFGLFVASTEEASIRKLQKGWYQHMLTLVGSAEA